MMRMLSLLAAMAMVPALAHGETEAEQAAAAFGRGKDLFNQKRYIPAVEAFEEAYRLRPHFMVHCSIARCFENLNRFVAAAARYRSCLDQGADKTQMADRLKASLQAIEQQIATVQVNSTRPGDDVLVDGRSAGQTPAEVRLDPGSHVVEVRRDGARPARSVVKVRGGEQMRVELAPTPSPTPSPAAAVRPTPAPPSQLPKRRRLSQLWFWGGAGVTAVLAVTAIGLGAQTLKDRSDYEDDPTREGLDRFKSRRLATNVLWGLSAAAAAGTTVLFFYTDFGGRDETRRTSSYGVGLRGVF